MSKATLDLAMKNHCFQKYNVRSSDLTFSKLLIFLYLIINKYN